MKLFKNVKFYMGFKSIGEWLFENSIPEVLSVNDKLEGILLIMR